MKLDLAVKNAKILIPIANKVRTKAGIIRGWLYCDIIDGYFVWQFKQMPGDEMFEREENIGGEVHAWMIDQET